MSIYKKENTHTLFLSFSLIYILYILSIHLSFSLLHHRNKNKTFKPRKNIPEGTRQYTLHKYVERTLGTGNLKEAVRLPPGEDLNEWLAANSESGSSRVLVEEEKSPGESPLSLARALSFTHL